MKILTTHPKEGTALHRLALGAAKYNPHHEFRIVEVHPKRPDSRQLEEFEKAYEWCDVWDAQYWKTAEMLREKYGEKLTLKPSVLSHHNPYDLSAKEWGAYDKVVINNQTMKKTLKGATYIPLAVDFAEFPWNPDYTERKTVCMVAQRIEGSKGVEPVARACRELGYQFILVGEVSDNNYFREILQHGVMFLEKITDDELRDVYRQSAIHVCNSKDNFESGTLPILEAMAMGVPVLTRRVGHVPDIYNEKNMLVRDGDPDNFDELKALLKGLMEDRQRRVEMREDAWQSVRNWNMERRARMLSTLWYKTLHKEPLVSVVMPVFGHPETVPEVLKALDLQTYPNIELVIVSDGDEQFDSLEGNSKWPVKYKRVGSKDKYGLGLARDTGVMMAEGEIIVFLDQRFLPCPELVQEFVQNLYPKKWLFGNKNNKRNFVENVSCIYRQEFIDMGMSNQLITGYGGMSQELRERAKRQGFKFVFVEKAVAVSQYSSHNYTGRKKEIYAMKEMLWRLNLY